METRPKPSNENLNRRYEERVKPDNPEGANYKRHMARYRFALPYISGKSLLDAGCGTGYGTHFLATNVSEAVGIDYSSDAIAYAQERFHRPNLRYLVMDCESIDFPSAVFNAVCSFEVIEHLHHPKKYLQEIGRVLTADGIALFSTPNKALSSPNGPPANPHHIEEFGLDTFRSMLTHAFNQVKIFGQGNTQNAQEALHGTPAKRLLAHLDPFRLRRFIPNRLYINANRAAGFAQEEDLQEADFPISESHPEKAEYFIAICRNPIKKY